MAERFCLERTSLRSVDVEKATKELNETPERREQEIIKLRKMIKGM
jgi:hypothetical protein